MPRLVPMMEQIVQTINTLIGNCKQVKFFEFVQEFTKHYKGVLANERIVSIVQSLVVRIINEHNAQNEDKIAIINKSWNCIRQVAETNDYI